MGFVSQPILRLLKQLIDTQTQQNGLKILPITPVHIYALNTIPFYHKDPFDRLLIVQAKLENMQLVSADGVFKQYEVELFW